MAFIIRVFAGTGKRAEAIGERLITVQINELNEVEMGNGRGKEKASSFSKLRPSMFVLNLRQKSAQDCDSDSERVLESESADLILQRLDHRLEN